MVDAGLMEIISFNFLRTLCGKYLENIVYLQLRRNNQTIYYYKTKNNLEVDFCLREGEKLLL